MMMPVVGSADHAALITHGRHPDVVTALAWLAFSHLPDELQSLSEPVYVAAMQLIERIPTDGTELTTALFTLVEAKDWMVRAGIRSDFGRPGPVVRPGFVVDPPRPATLADLPPFGPGALPGFTDAPRTRAADGTVRDAA